VIHATLLLARHKKALVSRQLHQLTAHSRLFTYVMPSVNRWQTALTAAGVAAAAATTAALSSRYIYLSSSPHGKHAHHWRRASVASCATVDPARGVVRLSISASGPEEDAGFFGSGRTTRERSLIGSNRGAEGERVSLLGPTLVQLRVPDKGADRRIFPSPRGGGSESNWGNTYTAFNIISTEPSPSGSVKERPSFDVVVRRTGRRGVADAVAALGPGSAIDVSPIKDAKSFSTRTREGEERAWPPPPSLVAGRAVVLVANGTGLAAVVSLLQRSGSPFSPAESGGMSVEAPLRIHVIDVRLPPPGGEGSGSGASSEPLLRSEIAALQSDFGGPENLSFAAVCGESELREALLSVGTAEERADAVVGVCGNSGLARQLTVAGWLQKGGDGCGFSAERVFPI
jgi:hypothetical protein